MEFFLLSAAPKVILKIGVEKPLGAPGNTAKRVLQPIQVSCSNKEIHF